MVDKVNSTQGQHNPTHADASNNHRSDDAAVGNGVAAGAAGTQQAGRESIVAVERGLNSAAGPNADKKSPGYVARDDVAGNAAKIVQDAPAQDKARMQAVVDKLGGAIDQDKLIPSDKFREVLDTAANGTNNERKGALAHLTRAAETLNSTRLAPGTAVAFDPPPPQNAAQEAHNRSVNAGTATAPAGSVEKAAGLPMVDKKLLDADLYYRQDNRSLATRITDAVAGRRTSAEQPLTVDTVKSTADAFGKEVNGTKKSPGPSQQLQTQQAWQQSQTAADPRQLKVSVADANGFSQWMRPNALETLAKSTPNQDARNFSIDGRNYSLNELLAIRKAGEPAVNAGVANAMQAKGGSPTAAAPAGMVANNQDKVYGNNPSQALPEGTTVGAAKTPLRPVDLPTAKQGGALGALGGFGVSSALALRDGKVTTEEAKQVAEHTVGGAALGALSAKGEQLVTPAIDRSLAARAGTSASPALGTSLTSKVLGSTAVGAVVSGGMSIYQNRDGLAKGESKAIGNVGADTLVGAASVAGGSIVGAAVTGALAGSAVPGLGTAAGFVVGLGVGVAITYGAQISGVRDSIANGASAAVDGVKDMASGAWNGIKGVFS